MQTWLYLNIWPTSIKMLGKKGWRSATTRDNIMDERQGVTGRPENSIRAKPH